MSSKVLLVVEEACSCGVVLSGVFVAVAVKVVGEDRRAAEEYTNVRAWRRVGRGLKRGGEGRGGERNRKERERGDIPWKHDNSTCHTNHLLRVCKGHAIKDFGPLWTSKMGFSVEASYSVSLLSLPQHDGKGLVVSPPSCQVDMGVQKVTNGGDKNMTVVLWSSSAAEF